MDGHDQQLKEHSTFKSAPAQNTLGTELQIINTFAEWSLWTASNVCCNPLSISFPIAFFVPGLSKLTSKIPISSVYFNWQQENRIRQEIKPKNKRSYILVLRTLLTRSFLTILELFVRVSIAFQNFFLSQLASVGILNTQPKSSTLKSIRSDQWREKLV